jgi:PAS domain S-box-containing protein
MSPDAAGPEKTPQRISADDRSRIESLISTYFDSSTLGFCILDTDFRYVAINGALATMHGLSRDEHLGKTLREVLGQVADQIESELGKLLATAQPRFDVEVSGLLPQKTKVGHWIEHYFPIKYGECGVQRIGVIVLEVTHQKQMEAKVSQLSSGMKLQMDRLQMLMDVGSILAANWNAGQVFPKISARIRRVLRHEYAGFSLQDSSTGMLVRQAEDFPLGK